MLKHCGQNIISFWTSVTEHAFFRFREFFLIQKNQKSFEKITLVVGLWFFQRIRGETIVLKINFHCKSKWTKTYFLESLSSFSLKKLKIFPENKTLGITHLLGLQWAGVEPITQWVWGECSTNWATESQNLKTIISVGCLSH